MNECDVSDWAPFGYLSARQESSSNGRPYICLDCHASCYSIASLKVHLATDHIEYAPYGCLFVSCEFRSYSRDRLEKHIRAKRHGQHNSFRYDEDVAKRQQLDEVLELIIRNDHINIAIDNTFTRVDHSRASVKSIGTKHQFSGNSSSPKRQKTNEEKAYDDYDATTRVEHSSAFVKSIGENQQLNVNSPSPKRQKRDEEEAYDDDDANDDDDDANDDDDDANDDDEATIEPQTEQPVITDDDALAWYNTIRVELPVTEPSTSSPIPASIQPPTFDKRLVSTKQTPQHPMEQRSTPSPAPQTPILQPLIYGKGLISTGRKRPRAMEEQRLTTELSVSAANPQMSDRAIQTLPPPDGSLFQSTDLNNNIAQTPQTPAVMSDGSSFGGRSVLSNRETAKSPTAGFFPAGGELLPTKPNPQTHSLVAFASIDTPRHRSKKSAGEPSVAELNACASDPKQTRITVNRDGSLGCRTLSGSVLSERSAVSSPVTTFPPAGGALLLSDAQPSMLVYEFEKFFCIVFEGEIAVTRTVLEEARSKLPSFPVVEKQASMEACTTYSVNYLRAFVTAVYGLPRKAIFLKDVRLFHFNCSSATSAARIASVQPTPWRQATENLIRDFKLMSYDQKDICSMLKGIFTRLQRGHTQNRRRHFPSATTPKK